MVVNTVPFEITKDEVFAIREVRDYLWADQKKDFECRKAEGCEKGHIFESLKAIDGLVHRAVYRFELYDRSYR